MKKILTTRDKIKNYLESGKTLTSLKAFELFHTLSLQQHIYALRNQGLEIYTLHEKNKNTGVRFAVYSVAPF